MSPKQYRDTHEVTRHRNKYKTDISSKKCYLMVSFVSEV